MRSETSGDDRDEKLNSSEGDNSEREYYEEKERVRIMRASVLERKQDKREGQNGDICKRGGERYVREREAARGRHGVW